jgi:polysaccharide biosynthesis/export protein
MARTLIRNPLLIGLLLAAGFHARAQEVPIGADLYTINPGDVLGVSVWKEPDLQREVLVSPDGRLSFPLAGDLNAAGMSIEALRTELANRLSRYIPDPVVTISALQINGNKIYVLGQVARPGEFIMVRNVDVMQAIGMAGGTTAFAQLDEVKILRRSSGTQIAIPFKYSDVAEGRKLEQNILLRAGDTVIVP